MALSLQEGGIGIRDWQRWIGRLPSFESESGTALERIVSCLLERQILHSDGIRLSFGDAGEDLYGRCHFLDLVSVFTSAPVFKVVHGRIELGTVDQITFLRHRSEDPMVLALGGRSWMVTSIDWQRREAFVIPEETKGKSQWEGGPMGLSWEFARAVHDLLSGDKESERWTSRARGALSSMRDRYDFLQSEGDVVLTNSKANEVRWFTFSGMIINAALSDALRQKGFHNILANNFFIRILGETNARAIAESVRSMHLNDVWSHFEISDDFLEKLKFVECLPTPLAHEVLMARLISDDEMEKTMTRKVIFRFE